MSEDENPEPSSPSETSGGIAPASRPRPRPRPRPSPDSDRTGGADGNGEAAPPRPKDKRVDITRFVDATAPATTAPNEKDAGAPGQDGGGAKPKRAGVRAYLRRSRRSRALVKLGILVAVAVVAAVVLRAYVVSPFYIPSESMEPTLQGCTGCGKTDDRVLVDKFSYHFHQPHVGDIVVFDRPKNFDSPDHQLIKRVVAISGDHVALRNGLVYVNGSRLNEPYLNKACGSHPSVPENGTSHWTVPNNDLFVMGDNRCNSTDSRTFGPVPISSVIGRAFAIFWPLSRLRTL